MTSTLPWRRIILHLSHIFLTEGLTFISSFCLSLSFPPFQPACLTYLYRYTMRPRVRS